MKYSNAAWGGVRFVLVISILLSLSAFIQPAFAATYAVNTTEDELDGDYATDCDPGNEVDCSLREAISAANDNSGADTISIPAGTYTLEIAGTEEDANQTGDFDITDTSGEMIIVGAGVDETIIDANSIDRIFSIAESITVSITDMTLQNGLSSNYGGAITNDGTLALENCVVKDSEAQAGAGGGIRSEGQINVDTCTFDSNTSSLASGAIHLRNSGDHTIHNSIFVDNYAEGRGGAIRHAAYDFGEPLIITDSTFSGNATDTTGGAIHADYPAVIMNSTFFANTSVSSGGALYLSDSSDSIEIINSTIAYNTSDLAGGGMYLTDGIVLTNSIIANNTAAEVDNDCYASENDVITSGYNLFSTTTDCDGLTSTETDFLNESAGFASSSLSDNGGFNQTLMILSSSKAVDAIPAESCLDYNDALLDEDQRGYERPEGSACDIGAVELDQTAPVVLTSSIDTHVECNLDTWSSDGATVTDNFATGLTVSVSGGVTTTAVGSYEITYSATDYDGNTHAPVVTVSVVDTIVPEISLTGNGTVTISEGETYTDDGATVTDLCDNEVTVTTAGTVDSNVPGTYTLTYSAEDTSGNEANELTRTITVEDDPEVIDNDVETGEGDGSDDAEETLGAVEDLTRSTDSMVLVEYEDGSTKTFQLFSSSAKAKVQLHTNGEILIAINKTYMRTFDAFTGEQIDQVKLFKSKQYKTKFKRYNVYKKVPGKNNVMVLAQTKQKHKKQFKLRSFVVKNGGKITKRPYRKITLNKNTNFSKLSINKNKKNGKKARVLIKRKGKTLKNWKYRVTKKKGILKKAS